MVLIVIWIADVCLIVGFWHFWCLLLLDMLIVLLFIGCYLRYYSCVCKCSGLLWFLKLGWLLVCVIVFVRALVVVVLLVCVCVFVCCVWLCLLELLCRL